MAFRFVIVLRLPFSVIATRTLSSSSISVEKFLTPLPRPFGFPVWPLMNRVGLDPSACPDPTFRPEISFYLLALRLGAATTDCPHRIGD